MNNHTIRIAEYSDLPAIKALMLTALKTDPKAFSSEYEEYAFNSNEWWNNYTGSYVYGLRDKMFLAINDTKIVGMIGVLYENKKRRQHASDFAWFYISQEERGKGIGRELLEKAIEDAKSQSVRKISLLVNGTQEKAIKLYKDFGFAQAGILKDQLKIEGEFVDTHIMEKFFV